MENWRYS